MGKGNGGPTRENVPASGSRGERFGNSANGIPTGKSMPKLDPADGVTPHVFADLKRREDDLLKLISEPCFFQIFHEPALFTH